MSATNLTTPPPVPTSSHAPPRPREAARFGAAARVAAACAILLASGGVRAWQARRIEGELRAGLKRPQFDLSQLPMALGPWKGTVTALDAQIARAAGADQIVTRRYTNQDTGAVIDVIVLYGPAAGVYLHSPEICYPSAGYVLAAGPDARAVPLDGRAAPFRALVYSKGEGAAAELQEVYYSWWYNGHWTPEVGKQKHFERIPGMFKVHLSRRTTPLEKRDVGNPCEALLGALLPEMERHMAAAQARPR
jgi:EpsI family protein